MMWFDILDQEIEKAREKLEKAKKRVQLNSRYPDNWDDAVREDTVLRTLKNLRRKIEKGG